MREIEDNKDKEFIKLALRYNFITPKDIEKSKEIQKRLPAHLSLKEIMKIYKIISNQNYNIIDTLQKYKTGRIQHTEEIIENKRKIHPEDRIVSEILLKENILSKEELQEIITLQKSLNEDFYKWTLLDVIKRKGIIDEGKIEDIKKKVKSILLKSEEEKFSNKLPTLEVIYGEDIGKKYKIQRDEITIGRIEDANFVLKDATVSRIHCTIKKENEEWIIIDMMSTHGTYINGELVTTKKRLKNGDQIKLGKTFIKFRY